MLLIGLTGNFGSGKTTVSHMLAQLGAVILDADTLGHELLQSGSQTYHQVIASFGRAILTPGDEIDRHKLGELVFNDATALVHLNQIMHPGIYESALQKIEQYRQQDTQVVVLEAALLVEAGWTPVVDQVWVTVAPDDIVADRINKQRGLAEDQVQARLQSQMPSEEKAKQAHVVIDTNCPLPELEATIRRLWRNLQSHPAAT